MSNEVKKPDAAKPAAAEGTANAALIAEITQAVMNATLPALAAALQSRQAPAALPTSVATGRGRDYGPQCVVCGQYTSACHSKHVEISVYPTRYPEFGDVFQGVFINGVKYLSNDESHTIAVPEAAAPHIEQTIRTFEKNEREISHGRQASHNMGHISRPKPATQAWR